MRKSGDPSDLMRRVDAIMAKAKRQGIDLDRDAVGMGLALEQVQAEEPARLARLAATRRFLAEEAALPGRIPRNVEDLTREDIERLVEADQADGGRGGRRGVAKRLPGEPSAVASALYRRWQKVAGPDVPWPSGNIGPPNRP